jgi:hypothetical protein
MNFDYIWELPARKAGLSTLISMDDQSTGSATTAASPAQSHELPRLMALLVSRAGLFLLFQCLIALVLRSWTRSEGYWLLSATLTNIVSIALLFYLFRSEGRSYLSLFRFDRLTLRKDVRIFIVLTLLTGPVVFGPNYLLSKWMWADAAIPYEMMFRSVESWLAVVLLFAFPVTIVFAELATYFGYIMPRLLGGLRPKWLAVALPVLFLSLQHMTLPFIPDLKFILYRGVVFLPFAALIGIAIYKRPTLFPWFAILHGVMDLGTAVMFVVE